MSILLLVHGPALTHSSLSLLLGGPQMRGSKKAQVPKPPLEWVRVRAKVG